MNLNRFTERSQEAVREAQTLATRASNQGVDVEHLMLALLQQREGVAGSLIQAAGADPAALQSRLQQEVDKLPKVSGPAARPDQVFVTQRLSQLLTKAEDEAGALKDEYVSVEHLILAAQADGGATGRLFRDNRLTREALMGALQKVRGSQRVTSQNPETTYQALERYGRDLTKLAAQGKVDPVIGRDEEIRRVIQVLSRPSKIM